MVKTFSVQRVNAMAKFVIGKYGTEGLKQTLKTLPTGHSEKSLRVRREFRDAANKFFETLPYSVTNFWVN